MPNGADAFVQGQVVNSKDSHPRAKAAGLSKSKFIMGLQCHKRLYLHCYEPQLRSLPDANTLAAFARGDEAGELARRLFAGGVLVDEPFYRHAEAENQTRQVMADTSVPAIFEAAFSHENIVVRADILERLPSGRWRLIEVKSSYTLYETHVMDLAIQAHVVMKAGLDVCESCVMLRNRGVTWNGDNGTLRQLFRLENLTDRVRLLGASIPIELAAQTRVLAQSTPPEVAMGEQCTRPYRCDFYDWCHCHEAHSPQTYGLAGELTSDKRRGPPTAS